MKQFFDKNIGFTRQERTVIIVLCIAFLVSAVLLLYSRLTGSNAAVKIYDYSLYDEEFKEKSDAPITLSPADSIKIQIINVMTKDDLIKIRGIGPTLAQRIIEYRDRTGAFHELDDLLSVSGIGAGRFRTIRQYLDSLVHK